MVKQSGALRHCMGGPQFESRTWHFFCSFSFTELIKRLIAHSQVTPLVAKELCGKDPRIESTSLQAYNQDFEEHWGCGRRSKFPKKRDTLKLLSLSLSDQRQKRQCWAGPWSSSRPVEYITVKKRERRKEDGWLIKYIKNPV